MIGTRVSHFEITGRLGHGGMGEVFLARDLTLGRQVAIKFISLDLAADPIALSRFRHEARNPADLSHPGLATIFESGVHEERAFIVMEYVPGETLLDRLSREPIKAAEVIRIGKAIADTLAYAHMNGLLHRDIKSSNIIIAPTGAVKLLDLGLSKRDGNTKITETGTAPATPAYASPEVITGEGADGRSDVWSLGIVLFESLVGRLPFEGETRAITLFKILNEPPPLPTAIRPGLPTELERIVLRCLEKEPGHRYQTAGDLAADLRRLENQLAPDRLATPLRATGTPAEKKARKSIWLPAMVAASGVAILLAGIAVKRSAHRENPAGPATLAIMDFEPQDTSANPERLSGVNELVQVAVTQASPCRVVSQELVDDLKRRGFGAQGKDSSGSASLELARKAGATLMLAGRVTETHDGLRLLWRLVRVSDGSNVAAQRLEAGSEAQLVDSMVEQLVPAVARGSELNPVSTAIAVDSLTSNNPAALQHYLKGLRLAADNDGASAAVEFRAAIRCDSLFALSYFKLAQTVEPNAQYPELIRSLDKAWALRSRLPVKDRMLLDGVRSQFTGDFEQAIAAFTEVRDRWPDSQQAIQGLVNANIWRWKFQEALEACDKGLRIFPEDVGLLGSRAQGLGFLGRAEEAISAARVLAEQKPRSAAAWIGLGDRYIDFGVPDSAEVAYQRALRIDPNNWNAKASRVSVLYSRGNNDSALELIDSLLSVDSCPPGTRATLREDGSFASLVNIWISLGQYSRCLSYFSSSDFEGSLESLADHRANIMIRSGKPLEAVRISRQSLAATPERGRHFDIFYIRALVESDSLASARQSLEELARRDGPRTFCHEGLAEYYLAAGKPDSALAEFRTARSCGVPRFVIDIDNRVGTARALVKLERYDDAIETLVKLERLYRGYVPVHYELGKAFESAGRSTEALQEFGLFLAGWKHADPGLPELIDAQRRWAALQRKLG